LEPIQGRSKQTEFIHEKPVDYCLGPFWPFCRFSMPLAAQAQGVIGVVSEAQPKVGAPPVRSEQRLAAWSVE